MQGKSHHCHVQSRSQASLVGRQMKRILHWNKPMVFLTATGLTSCSGLKRQATSANHSVCVLWLSYYNCSEPIASNRDSMKNELVNSFPLTSSQQRKILWMEFKVCGRTAVSKSKTKSGAIWHISVPKCHQEVQITATWLKMLFFIAASVK